MVVVPALRGFQRRNSRRDLVRFTFFGVEGGLFWCSWVPVLMPGDLNAKHPGSEQDGRPRSIRTSAAMFHSWLGCLWPRLPIVPALGKVRLETNRGGWGLAKRVPAGFLQDAFPVVCSTRALERLR